jgi:DedD protein
MNHNLDDLIIDEPEVSKSSSSSKSILSKVALVVIVLIVGVVVSKLVMSDKGDPIETVKDKELQGIVDPGKTDPEFADLAKDGAPKVEDKKSISDIEGDSDLQMIKESSNTQTLSKNDNVDFGDGSDFNSDYGMDSGFGSSSIQDTPTPTKPATTSMEAPESSFTEAQPQYTPPPKPKPKPKPAPAPKRTTTHHTTAPAGMYYIQVGAFSKKPSEKYLNSIRAKGYKVFVLHSPNSTLYKVRVGPYRTRDEANAKLSSVNRALNIKALVLKGK